MTRRNLFKGVTGAVGIFLFPRTAANAPETVVTAPVEEAVTYTNVLSEEAPTDLSIESLERALQEWKAEYPYRQMGLVIPMSDVRPYSLNLFNRTVRKMYSNDE